MALTVLDFKLACLLASQYVVLATKIEHPEQSDSGGQPHGSRTNFRYHAPKLPQFFKSITGGGGMPPPVTWNEKPGFGRYFADKNFLGSAFWNKLGRDIFTFTLYGAEVSAICLACIRRHIEGNSFTDQQMLTMSGVSKQISPNVRWEEVVGKIKQKVGFLTETPYTNNHRQISSVIADLATADSNPNSQLPVYLAHHTWNAAASQVLINSKQAEYAWGDVLQWIQNWDELVPAERVKVHSAGVVEFQILENPRILIENPKLKFDWHVDHVQIPSWLDGEIVAATDLITYENLDQAKGWYGHEISKTVAWQLQDADGNMHLPPKELFEYTANPIFPRRFIRINTNFYHGTLSNWSRSNWIHGTRESITCFKQRMKVTLVQEDRLLNTRLGF